MTDADSDQRRRRIIITVVILAAIAIGFFLISFMQH